MKNSHIHKFTSLLLSAVMLSMAGCAHAQQTAEFKVTSHAQQIIDGFGASDAWSMWQIGTWADTLQNQVADWLFSTDTFADGTPKGIG
jgi:O-glycosyl hydrolase